ncbi:hypothetical protein [Deinococcus fonticola]|uniref:hypothetical protein n=1 Tax=Deinococcus fonticola TaxID=2528713 RepID=UPI00107509D6|nr:hypothetical protein [Deinococcus fonticola]
MTALQSTLPTLMANEAQAMGEASLQRSIYGQPHAHPPTGRLRSLFGATPAGAGIVRIYSQAQYASLVEGFNPGSMGFDGATGRASGLGGWQPSSSQPPYFGRTPGNPAPAPHVSAAALRALWVARREVLKAVRST